MLNRPITYKMMLRIIGVLLLLWALYLFLRFAIEPIGEYFSGGHSETQLHIQISFAGTLLYSIYFGGILFFVAFGILLLSFSSQRVNIIYGSIQVAIWLIGISVWFQSNNEFNPFPQNSFWIIATLTCSLVLLALYAPLVYLLRKFLSKTEEASHLYSQHTLK